MKTYMLVAALLWLLAVPVVQGQTESPLVTEPGTIVGVTPGSEPESVEGIILRDVVFTEAGTIAGANPGAQPEPVTEVSRSQRSASGLNKVVEIRWAAKKSGAVLESAEELGGKWTPVAEAIVLVHGENKLLLPVSSASRFFRVR
jgi:hypothetical protein